jgi:predicted nuclease of predicted toxin-antitoxin system
MGSRDKRRVGNTGMKLLLDMNVPLKYGTLLVNKGIDSTIWSDVGSPNAKDVEIMSYARDNDFIVLTYDLDFSAILSSTHDLKPSIIQIRVSVLHAERVVNLIATALAQNKGDLEKGAIISIDLHKARLRLLPL